MGSFVAIAFTADLVISTAQRGITDDYARRFMRGTITLIEDELFRHPRGSWHKQIEQIDEKFSYHLDIVERMSAVDTSGVEPLYTPLSAAMDVHLRLREDAVTEGNQREANQRSAPAVEAGLFLVPKVIE